MQILLSENWSQPEMKCSYCLSPVQFMTWGIRQEVLWIFSFLISSVQKVSSPGCKVKQDLPITLQTDLSRWKAPRSHQQKVQHCSTPSETASPHHFQRGNTTALQISVGRNKAPTRRRQKSKLWDTVMTPPCTKPPFLSPWPRLGPLGL